MKQPYWLGRDECLALHDMMLSHYGGSPGLRDAELLNSALARAQQLFHSGEPDLVALAAAYAKGIVKSRPFLDGNLRTGCMMGAGFLARNGFEFIASEAETVERTLALAAGEIDESAYAAWMKASSSRSELLTMGSCHATQNAFRCMRESWAGLVASYPQPWQPDHAG